MGTGEEGSKRGRDDSKYSVKLPEIRILGQPVQSCLNKGENKSDLENKAE
jgi:hypothetical protein